MLFRSYLRIIYLKTACLFGSAAQAGAVLGKAPPELSEALKRYGEALGMAFQIVDDALDYVESPKTGKNHGTDLMVYGNSVDIQIILANY